MRGMALTAAAPLRAAEGAVGGGTGRPTRARRRSSKGSAPRGAAGQAAAGSLMSAFQQAEQNITLPSQRVLRASLDAARTALRLAEETP
jgi:hypothetical protein